MARQGMLVDLRRCAGCYACVVACQMWNNQSPGVAWGHVERREWEDGETSHRSYLPLACMHCIDAPCVAACATGANYKRDDGIVVVDYDVCIGCGTCIEVCPYGARTINASEAYYFDAEEAAPYETEGPQRVNVAEKCIFCYPRIDRGLEPACVHNCPGGARFFGDVEDPESAISQKIAQEGDAVHNLSGTSFYYVPFSTMPADLLPMPGFYKNESADAGKGEGEQAEGAADASPLMVAGGVAAVAVVGAGVGVAVKRSRSKRPAGPDASQVETETQREEGSADHE